MVGGFVYAFFIVIIAEWVNRVRFVWVVVTRLRRVERNHFYSQHVASTLVRAFLGLPCVAFRHFQAERPFAPIRAAFLGCSEKNETVVQVHIAVLGELEDECWQFVVGGEVLANRIEDKVVVHIDGVVQLGRLNLHFELGSWTKNQRNRCGCSEILQKKRADAIIAWLKRAIEVHRTSHVARSSEDTFREHLRHHVGTVVHGSCASRQT